MLNAKSKTNQNCLSIFLHTPKTAGSTFISLAEDQYNKDEIMRLYEPEDFKRLQQMSDGEKSRFRFATGHVFFGIHSSFPQEFTYFTFLREPIDRIISFYYYVRQFPDHHIGKEIINKKLSLKDFVGSKINPRLENNQVRRLSGRQFGHCDHEHLETAKQNLKKYFLLVGLNDRFDETVLLLKKALGWKTPFYFNKNVNKNRLSKKQVDLETIREIEKYNKLDMELYQYTKEIFNDQITALGTSFQAELKAFQLLQDQRNKNPCPEDGQASVTQKNNNDTTIDILNIIAQLIYVFEYEVAFWVTRHAVELYRDSFISQLKDIFEKKFSEIKNKSLTKNSQTEILNDVGEALFNRGDADGAVKIFKMVLSIDPSYSMAYNNIGVINLINGDLDSSFDNFSKAFTLDPNNDVIATNHSKISRV